MYSLNSRDDNSASSSMRLHMPTQIPKPCHINHDTVRGPSQGILNSGIKWLDLIEKGTHVASIDNGVY
jgi:hypothetical protein